MGFITEFTSLQREVHENARLKGFHDTMQHPAVGLALIHSEVSELLEVIRKDEAKLPDEKVLTVTRAEAELADVVIRCMDFAELHGMALAKAVVDKHLFNTTRPRMHGGKSF